MPTDYFRGCRKAYASIIKAFAANNIVALFVTGVPIYYILSLGIYQSARSVLSYYTSAVWVFLSILLMAWIIALVAVWKTMPNLLTVGLFVYKAFGYWCLVSSFLAVIYLSPYVPGIVLSYALWALMPSIAFLLICGDILRSVRTRLYEVLEKPATVTAITTVTAIAPTVVVDTAPIATP
jgi:hypothetical protein